MQEWGRTYNACALRLYLKCVLHGEKFSRFEEAVHKVCTGSLEVQRIRRGVLINWWNNHQNRYCYMEADKSANALWQQATGDSPKLQMFCNDLWCSRKRTEMLLSELRRVHNA
eukprot:gnl/MRDRNA2_/MRDRNA2_48184_c0_seq2.p1 gnl/MRDRNA2_/MRDRNA2_48184_c0~~gnl/MRDRNA2_/MRDRNA2_48184_c0_seq2.p1  ORF type:complete len:113 (+),score=7.54 gnl/MRDRNA2_/MRDRNA2_48184_c0_seq2:381-719(+)